MSQIIDGKVPDIGDFTDVPVLDQFVKIGDSIKVDDPICTLESDKATMEVPCSATGLVKEVLFKPGDKVSEGTVLIRVESQAAASTKTPPAQPASSPTETASGALSLIHI